MLTIYAVGHSTRPLEKYIELLRSHEITLNADIRTVPRSRHNPQFNRESLEIELPKAHIRYIHLTDLGGFRRPLENSINVGWESASFQGFADYMLSEEFSGALANLISLAKKQHVALMCSEGNPYRCHRLLVADALTVRGIRVLHIASRKIVKRHLLTPFARVEGIQVTYPKEEEPSSAEA